MAKKKPEKRFKERYCCDYAERRVEVDDYDEGCQLDEDTRDMGWFVDTDLSSDTLAGLIQEIRNQYGLEMDDLFIPDDDDTTTIIGFDRLENADGEVPTKHERTQWKKGRLKLYRADYSFSVCKRKVSPIPVSEFDKAGITHH